MPRSTSAALWAIGSRAWIRSRSSSSSNCACRARIARTARRLQPRHHRRGHAGAAAQSAGRSRRHRRLGGSGPGRGDHVLFGPLGEFRARSAARRHRRRVRRHRPRLLDRRARRQHHGPHPRRRRVVEPRRRADRARAQSVAESLCRARNHLLADGFAGRPQPSPCLSGRAADADRLGADREFRARRWMRSLSARTRRTASASISTGCA